MLTTNLIIHERTRTCDNAPLGSHYAYTKPLAFMRRNQEVNTQYKYENGKRFNITENISSRIEFKRKFSLPEMYRATVFAPRAMSKLIGNKKSKLVDQNFVKRFQLAVTEVNGCAICSYGHAKMALRQGMDKVWYLISTY